MVYTTDLKSVDASHAGSSPASGTMIHPKLKKTIVALHINAVLNVLVGIAFLTATILMGVFVGDDFFSSQDDIMSSVIVLLYFSFVAAILFGSAIFIEVVIFHLKHQRYWAWIAAIILCGINLPSIYFVLGLVGLFGLADKIVARQFVEEK